MRGVHSRAAIIVSGREERARNDSRWQPPLNHATFICVNKQPLPLILAILLIPHLVNSTAQNQRPFYIRKFNELENKIFVKLFEKSALAKRCFHFLLVIQLLLLLLLVRFIFSQNARTLWIYSFVYMQIGNTGSDHSVQVCSLVNGWQRGWPPSPSHPIAPIPMPHSPDR